MAAVVEPDKMLLVLVDLTGRLAGALIPAMFTELLTSGLIYT
jgi:hypothetical protein